MSKNWQKARHWFTLCFRNLPYTDAEWARKNEHRAKVREANPRSRKDPKWLDKYKELTTRPCHRMRWGPAAYSETEARKLCEAALKAGAQMVSYSCEGPRRSGGLWEKRKKGSWKKVK